MWADFLSASGGRDAIGQQLKAAAASTPQLWRHNSAHIWGLMPVHPISTSSPFCRLTSSEERLFDRRLQNYLKRTLARWPVCHF